MIKPITKKCAMEISELIDRHRDKALDGEVDDVQMLAEIAWYLAERLSGQNLPPQYDGSLAVIRIEQDHPDPV